MKKYIMTEQGLAEMSPYTIDPDIEKPEYSDFNEFTTFYHFSTGTIGYTYRESEIEFVKEAYQNKKAGWAKWCGPVFPGMTTRTIARLRTTQVSEFERAKALIIDAIKLDKSMRGLVMISKIIELINNLKS